MHMFKISYGNIVSEHDQIMIIIISVYDAPFDTLSSKAFCSRKFPSWREYRPPYGTFFKIFQNKISKSFLTGLETNK